MDKPKSEVVRVRLSPAMKAALPGGRGKQSAFIRKAVAHFIETRDGTKRLPIPREAELQTMQWLLRELNAIGVNLNQAVMMLHLAEQGRDSPPSADEIRTLHRQLIGMARQVESVVSYWRRDV